MICSISYFYERRYESSIARLKAVFLHVDFVGGNALGETVAEISWI